MATPLNGQTIDPNRNCHASGACPSDGGALVDVARKPEPDTKQVFLVIERPKRRIFAQNARKGTFRELRLTGQEAIVKTGQSNLLLIVVTSRRYLAYSAFFTPWHIENQGSNERLLDLKVEDSVAIILTTRRVLTFDARRGKWAVRNRR